MTDKVKCENCGNAVVPRLWMTDTKSMIVHRKNEHICPICGVTMYVSGGGHTSLGKLLFLIVFVPLAFLFIGKLLAVPFLYLGFGALSHWMGFIAFGALMVYLYRRKNRTRHRH